jgi:ferritin-like metal-binding protein YciE
MTEQRGINMEKNDLHDFFVTHLNKIHTAKKHLLSKLPEILDNAHFYDLKKGIHETAEEVQKQIERLNEIYNLMNILPSYSDSNGLVGLVDDSFKDIKYHSRDPELRDMSILFYLQNIESLEMASFQVLQMLAVKLKDERIKKLIKENYDDAKAARTLLLLITTKYIVTV